MSPHKCLADSKLATNELDTMPGTEDKNAARANPAEHGTLNMIADCDIMTEKRRSFGEPRPALPHNIGSTL